MSLLSQFQTFLGSILFGIVYSLIWTLFNRVFYNKKIWYIRIWLEIILFITYAYMYYVFLCYYIDGIFNVFYIVGLVAGVIIYFKFYASGFEYLFECLAKFGNKFILKPINLKITKYRDNLKLAKGKKKHDQKIKQTNKSIN